MEKVHILLNINCHCYVKNSRKLIKAGVFYNIIKPYWCDIGGIHVHFASIHILSTTQLLESCTVNVIARSSNPVNAYLIYSSQIVHGKDHRGQPADGLGSPLGSIMFLFNHIIVCALVKVKYAMK